MPRQTPKSYALHAHACEAHGMKFGRYYVVEVSMRPNNPVFRCIAMNARDDGSVRIVSSGLEPDDEAIRLDQIAFFRVVEEITAMLGRPSRLMPDDPDRNATA